MSRWRPSRGYGAGLRRALRRWRVAREMAMLRRFLDANAI